MNRSLITETLRRPRAVWWAVLVAVCFALAPTLNHALAYAGVEGAESIEICTTQGPQILASDALLGTIQDFNPATNPVPKSNERHCPFCLHQADRNVPGPYLFPSVLKARSPQQEIPAKLAFFYTGKMPSWAPPRGPPTAVAL